MQLCGSLSSADKALECTPTFLRRSVRNPIHRPDPSPRAHSIKGEGWERDYSYMVKGRLHDLEVGFTKKTGGPAHHNSVRMQRLRGNCAEGFAILCIHHFLKTLILQSKGSATATIIVRAPTQ